MGGAGGMAGLSVVFWLVTSAVAATTAATTAAPPEPRLPMRLTLPEALAIFRSYGLDLLLADADVASAAGDLRAAQALPNPSASLSLGKTFRYDPSQCAGCSDIPWSVGLSDSAALVQLVSGKSGLRTAAARAALAAARAGRADAQRTLEFQLKQAYLAVALAQRALAVARTIRDDADAIATLNDTRYKVGAISEADAAKAETAFLEAEQVVDTARLGLREAQLGLATLLGARSAVPELTVDDTLLTAAAPPLLVAASRADLIARAIAARPDLHAAGHELARAKSALALAHRSLVPDAELSVQYQAEGTSQNAIQPPTLTGSLALPLPVLYQQQGDVQKAEADVRAQQTTRAKVEAQVVADVESAFAAFTTARSQLERMQSRLLAAAGRTRDLVRLQYEKGAATLLELLDAERTYAATQLESLQDQAALRLAVFQMELALNEELTP